MSRWTQRDMSLSIVENSISSTGYELVQNKNPMRLFEAVYTFQFVELRKYSTCMGIDSSMHGQNEVLRASL